ncbi:hypothetical protein [Ottowia sp.]|uniref:hypothetical protein n=1 Tax=Ottowia sp. TaxID=1898956 RepID=UPI0025DB8FF7|nr:hypothetical protein [Ottowia sp.]MBK6616455.1 hypothetical protein [Ottowia sp.]
MKNAFNTAIEELLAAQAARDAGELGPYPYSLKREAALSKAIVALAQTHGVRLQEPLQIDARGEYSIVALMEGRSNATMGCAQYGPALAELLTRYGSRCGISPGAVVAENGWCHLNHLSAEKMVLDVYDAVDHEAST